MTRTPCSRICAGAAPWRIAPISRFWVLTKYDDVIARWPTRNFSTAYQNVVPRVATSGRRPPLHLDPPEHTPYRRAISPLFYPDRMRHWEPVVRKIVSDLLAPLVERGKCDICVDFSYRLPIFVLAEFFHIPAEQAEKIRDIGADFNRALQVRDNAMLEKTSLFLYDVAREIIALRKKEPLDPGVDPTSAIRGARQRRQPPAEDMVLGTIDCWWWALSRHDVHRLMAVHLPGTGAFRHAQADPSLIPDALEELLRLYALSRVRAPPSRTWKWRTADQEGRPIAGVHSAIATRTRSRIPTRSGSTAKATRSTWRSDADRTSAPARRWPG